MRRWSRLAAVCIAAGMTLAVAGCGQLFQVKGSTSQPTLEELTQRVDQLEAQVSELNAAVAGMGQVRGQAATSSAASGQRGAANGAIQAIVTASYLNVHPQPNVTTPRVGVLKHDTVVSVLATQGMWTKIGFRSLQGWVESRYLEKPGMSQTTQSGAAAPAAPAKSTSVAPASSGASAAPANNASVGVWGGGSSSAPAGTSSGAAPGGSSTLPSG